jgi:hypothetical protein
VFLIFGTLAPLSGLGEDRELAKIKLYGREPTPPSGLFKNLDAPRVRLWSLMTGRILP